MTSGTEMNRPSKEMTAEHEQALKWAREQNFGSVAARYAKFCAEAYDIARSETLEAFNMRVRATTRASHETDEPLHASAALTEFMAQLGETMSMEDGATPADYLQRARDIREWCHDHQTSLNFVDVLKIAEGVFEQYRKDQPKWWKRMDGTPILNDVAVRMAEAFRDAARSAQKADEQLK